MSMKKSQSKDLCLMFYNEPDKRGSCRELGRPWEGRRERRCYSVSRNWRQLAEERHLPQSALRKGRKGRTCDEAKPNNGTLDFILGIFTSIDEGAAHFSAPDRKLDESMPSH